MKIHLCQSIRGALRHQILDGFQHDDGHPMTRDEAFNALCDELTKGHEVLPIVACDNFDFQKGCLGHPEDPSPHSAIRIPQSAFPQ